MNEDSIRLLRECDAGIQMGTETLDRILKDVRNPAFRSVLVRCRNHHLHLGREIAMRLDGAGIRGKPLHRAAARMAKWKICWKMRLHPDERTAADLVTQGGNMGIQSLFRYLNRYPAAEEGARNLTLALIRSEENLVAQTRSYL